MANSVWGPTQEAQRNAIEIAMRKTALAEDRRRFEIGLAQAKAERDSEDQKALFEIVSKAQQARIKYTQDMMKSAYEKGDTQGVRAFGEPLRAEGLPVPANEMAGPSLPGQLSPVQYFSAPQKPPGSIEGALAQLNEKNPAKLAELYNAKYGKNGMRLEVGPDGGITFAQGAGVEGMQLTKPQQSKVQEKAINASEGLKRMEGIVRSFKPEFLQIPSKIGAEWTALKDKLNMGEISDKDQEFLEDYSVFKQNSLENINLYIKEITGAQMSEKEADRIRKAMPDPGEGIFGGDSPKEFRSKLVNTYKKMKASFARYNYYLKMGIPAEKVQTMISSSSVISLDEMEHMIDERASKIKTENPSLTIKQVAAQVAKEFGL